MYRRDRLPCTPANANETNESTCEIENKPTERAAMKLQRLTIDICLTIIDRFSRFPMAAPLENRGIYNSKQIHFSNNGFVFLAQGLHFEQREQGLHFLKMAENIRSSVNVQFTNSIRPTRIEK